MPGRFTPATLRAHIAAGKLEPLYLITGDDEVEMSALAAAFVGAVDEDFRVFNVQRFYGSDAGVNLSAVCDAAATLPLLSPRRVVVLQQAERILAPRRGKSPDGGNEGADPGGQAEAGKPGAQLAALKQYAERPHGHAVVAIIGTGLERPFEALGKDAALVICDLSGDIVRVLEAEHGVRFDRQAADLLRERAGADLGRLRADVERVVMYAAGRTTITRDQVDEAIGRASASNNLWIEVANRRTASALRELALELEEGSAGAPFMLLGLLRSVVERTVVARDLPAAVNALMRTDLALKTSGGDPRVLLERLVVEVCATGRE